MCCGSWGHKESDITEQLNYTELNPLLFFFFFSLNNNPGVGYWLTLYKDGERSFNDGKIQCLISVDAAHMQLGKCSYFWVRTHLRLKLAIEGL